MKDTVKNFAVDWQDWASQQNLGWLEVAGWQSRIKDLAVLADPSGELLEELKENGII